MRPALARLLTDVISHRPLVSTDKQGKPVFGGTISYRARIDENRVVRYSADGTQHLVAGPTFVADLQVKEQDQITLPDGRVRIVSSSDVVREPTGALSHSEVYFT